MKTDDLISALVVDRTLPMGPIWLRVFAAVLLGGGVSLAAFLWQLGVREDLVEAVTTWRFDVKIAIVLVAIMSAFADCVWLAQPHRFTPVSRASLSFPLLLVTAIGIEFSFMPAGEWLPRLVGSNALICLVSIPALSLVPFAVIMVAMRGGAPGAPVAAGAAVGLLAAAMGSLLYALHCVDDSALFVATWYTLASAPIVAAGAVIGSRVLRW